MRVECVRAIEEMALSDPRIVVVSSDPGPGFMPELAAKHPDRLMLEGVCEQALVGFCAGMASEGYYPYIIMIAVFGTRRCYEQLLLDFGLHQLSGCMVGIGGGFNYATMGPTHIAVDDLSLVSNIPNAAILTPAEPDEAVLLTKRAREFPGLSYLRVAGTTASLASPRGDIVWGKGRLLGESGPVLFISCGATSLEVESAITILKDVGIRASAIHLPTVRPLDVDLIRRQAKSAKVVLCVEEHRQIGGLSSAVLHALATADPPVAPSRFASVSVGDTYPSGNGDYHDLMTHYGMTGAQLAERARKLLSNAGG
jgi:transketolase